MVHELISLACRGVVREWHAGVPCLSYGTFRRPQVRSNKCPFGFDPSDPFTQYHNRLAQRTCFVLTIALLSGAFISVEQPRNSRLYRLHCYRQLLHLGCVISHFAFCSSGSAFHKPSKWLHNKPWLIKLESKCECRHKGGHFKIEGAFTHDNIRIFQDRCQPSVTAVYGEPPQVGQSVAAYSAAYPLPLVRSMAIGSLAAKNGCIDLIPSHIRARSFAEVDEEHDEVAHLFLPAESVQLRDWFEDPEWISEVMNSCEFRELFRFKFKSPGHINVNETRTFKTWIKSMAKSSPDTRFVGFLDSRVTIGATAKGRSSSYAISRVLQGTLPYLIGGGLFPGCLHCYSADNRADDPSRDRPVQSPSKLIPEWLRRLRAGDSRLFDLVVESSRVPKLCGRWLRFLLLLGGDIERNPGPTGNRAPHGPLDLSTGFATVTVERMKRCVDGFQAWVEEEAQLTWSTLIKDPHATCLALRGYGLYCFEAGLPRYLFVYAMTGIQELYPLCRQFMSLGWQIDRKWQIHEPGTCRPVLPPVIIRAAVTLALIWQWYAWAAIVLLGFGAMLHPSEMMALQRRDLIFPSDIGHDSNSLFLRIRDPKTARFARRQHGRIDDQVIIDIALKVFGNLDSNEKLFPGTINSFRKQWNSVMQCLGVPHSQFQHGATPGVLRGSGATYMYTTSEDVNWVAWRGRWSRVRTLEYYLQEVGAFVLIHSLKPAAKSKIFQLSKFSWPVIRQTFDLTG